MPNKSIQIMKGPTVGNIMKDYRKYDSPLVTAGEMPAQIGQPKIAGNIRSTALRKFDN